MVDFGHYALETRDIGLTVARALEVVVGVVGGAGMAWLARTAHSDRLDVLDCRGEFGVRPGDQITVPVGFLPSYRTSQPVMVTDWCRETRFEELPVLREAGVRSTLSAGVQVAGRAYRLAVHDVVPRAFDLAEVGVVQSIAHLLAAAMERSRDESMRAAATAFGRFALQSQDLARTLERSVDVAREVLEAPMGALLRVVGLRQTEILCSRGTTGIVAGDLLDLPDHLLAAYRTELPYTATDWSADERETPGGVHATGTRATLSVPVLIEGEMCRLVVMDVRPRQFDTVEQEFLQSVAHLLAAAMDRHRSEAARAAVATFGRVALDSPDAKTTIRQALDMVLEVLDAPMGGWVRPAGPDRMVVVQSIGWRPPGDTFAVPADFLSATPDALRPMVSGDWRTDQPHPDMSTAVQAAGVLSSISVAVPVDGQPCRLQVMDTKPRRFAEAEVDFLQSVAHLLAAALERARTERAQAAVAALGRFALQSRDIAATISQAVELVTQVLDAPMGGVSCPSRPGWVSMVHSLGAAGVEPGAEFPAPPELIKVMHVAPEPVVIHDWATETRFRQSAASRASGVRSSLSVGFPVEGRIWRLGIMDMRPRRFSTTEVDFVQSLAHILATAMDRHRTEARLRDSTRQLQEVLLPVELPVLPGIEAAARYVPAGGDQVGGDWYDVLPLPQGRVALVMGDVEGHDQTAAALMGQVRNVLRAYAADGHSPAEILARVNKFVSTHSTRLVTCCYLELDAQGRTVTAATAGHPGPLVLHHDDTVTPLPIHRSLMLGVDERHAYRERTTLLLDARTLLLVTDGLVDEFPSALHQGIGPFSAAVGELAHEAVDVLADRLVSCRAAADGPRDDAALLAVQLTTEPLADIGTVRRTFANDASVIRAARAFAHDVLTIWGLPDLREPAVLAISELVTNAVVHTISDVEVTVRRKGERRVWIGVYDSSDQPPRAPVDLDPGRGDAACPDGDDDGLGAAWAALEPGGRGLLLVSRLADDWGVIHASDRQGKTVWLDLSIPHGPDLPTTTPRG